MRPGARAIAGLARLTLLEARRTAVGKSVVAAIAIALCLALFMSRIVLTEQARAAVVTYAVIVRLSLVLLIAQSIIANTVRDLHERLVEHFLALPLTRLQYAVGRWLGWAAVEKIIKTLQSWPRCRINQLVEAALWPRVDQLV